VLTRKAAFLVLRNGCFTEHSTVTKQVFANFAIGLLSLISSCDVCHIGYLHFVAAACGYDPFAEDLKLTFLSSLAARWT
jgi:hypothetical protein